MDAMTSFGDLLGPQPTLLPGDEDAESALLNHEDPAKVAAEHPTASIAWAYLAEAALELADLRHYDGVSETCALNVIAGEFCGRAHLLATVLMQVSNASPSDGEKLEDL